MTSTSAAAAAVAALIRLRLFDDEGDDESVENEVIAGGLQRPDAFSRHFRLSSGGHPPPKMWSSTGYALPRSVKFSLTAV